MRNKISLRRDPPAGRARLLVVGSVIGIVWGRLFDPISGRRRRAMLRDRTAAVVRRGGRKAGRFASYASGFAKRATHRREKPKEYDDATLADKIKSEIFRPADVPKGQININVQEGVVQLRGQVPSPEMIDDLEEQVRRIHGVREVENLLHPPGTEPQMHH
jgi:osmotically-inducible protein OsmY